MRFNDGGLGFCKKARKRLLVGILQPTAGCVGAIGNLIKCFNGNGLCVAHGRAVSARDAVSAFLHLGFTTFIHFKGGSWAHHGTLLAARAGGFIGDHDPRLVITLRK